MLRYSFRSKDLERLEKQLVEMGYEVEAKVERELNNRGKVISKQKLLINSEQICCYLNPKEAFVGFRCGSCGKILSEKDKELINIIKKEYKLLFPPELIYAAGAVSIALLLANII